MYKFRVIISKVAVAYKIWHIFSNFQNSAISLYFNRFHVLKSGIPLVIKSDMPNIHTSKLHFKAYKPFQIYFTLKKMTELTSFTTSSRDDLMSLLEGDNQVENLANVLNVTVDEVQGASGFHPDLIPANAIIHNCILKGLTAKDVSSILSIPYPDLIKTIQNSVTE